jgi:hypothetical protein
MISPNVGTAGQTLVTATIHGVGTSTESVKLTDDSTIGRVCDEIEIVSYATL